MKAGEFPSRGFAHSQILIWMSTTISVWVIKSFLDDFSCDYRRVLLFLPKIILQDPWTIYSNRDVECLSQKHKNYMGGAVIGILLYYPLSSLLYPNLQYLNKGNDFKHDTSFVIVLNQVKLILISKFGNI